MKFNFTLYIFGFLCIFAFALSANAVRIDGNTNDWIGIAGNEGTLTFSAGEVIWKDYVEDDTGDGDYEYPRAELEGWMPENGLDIDEFRLTSDGQYMYFLVKTAGPPIYMSVGIFIATSPNGSTTIGHNANIDLPASLAWDAGIILGDSGGPRGQRILMNISYNGGVSYPDTYEWPERSGAQVEAFFAQDNPVIEMRVPLESSPDTKDGIPNPANKSFKFIVLLGLAKPNLPSNAIVDFHDTLLPGEEDNWQASGADIEGKAPNVFDLIGSTPAQQEIDLGLYDNANFTLLERSIITVQFGSDGLPASESVSQKGKLTTTWGRLKF